MSLTRTEIHEQWIFKVVQRWLDIICMVVETIVLHKSQFTTKNKRGRIDFRENVDVLLIILRVYDKIYLMIWLLATVYIAHL